MTPEAEVESQAAALRQAVTFGDSERASHSAGLYCQAVRESVAGLPWPEASRRLAEAQTLLEWARRNLRAHRARLASQLHDAQRLARYDNETPLPPNTWTIRG